MRKCDIFLNERGHLLGEHGFISDAGRVERTINGNIVFYHYSHQENLEKIFSPNNGLWARLNVVHCDIALEFVGSYLVEALLEPLPIWVNCSPYFGDLGLEMMKAYVGNILLRIEVPPDFPNLYVADTTHNFECKHLERRERVALDLDYDCRTGHESCKAEINSYIPLLQYNGGHVAPNIKVIRGSVN